MRFREAVAAELERRRRRNQRYSLRQFARGLGVHHSTVSRLLRGARPVPPRTLLTMATHLGMSPAQAADFLSREDDAAVVEAIRRPAFRPDSRWLASATGISVDGVNVVLQKLLRIGSLRMSSADRWELRGKESNE
jgi:transcriptional regulator with XRE-family HTH domain